ncbi:efflux RND transporter periplasmic adaptor subunit [Thermithiobacillus plumbiphilus]|uniref:Efflux RND transporter periplasmic adaptor subunit n=1 Tax=Thermithiobacillus plumbiphilus TaxID=1729899 RepID=A0ABU9D8S5_9PROT
MKKILITLLVLSLLGALGFGIWWATKPDAPAREGPQSRRGGGAMSGPMPVQVTQAVTRPMPVTLDAIGSVEAGHRVEIRPQVSGTLASVNFTEGQTVREGQLLFRIDPALFEAAVAQARAALQRDQAQLREAQAQARRLQPLASREYITRQEYEQAQANASALAATVAADRAQLRQAEIQLGYSRIHAPISGVAGNLAVRAGNLVGANDTTPLVVINQITPVRVAFNLPQEQLDSVRAAQAQGSVRVQALSQDTGKLLEEGPLVFIDNTVNAANGTVLMKAEMPNQNQTLWPGQFVAVRMILRVQPEALVIPTVALRTGQDGSYVFVAAQGKTQMRPVTLDRQIGELVVIAKGLRPGEQVITQIPRNLAPGQSIRVQGAGGGDGARPNATQRPEARP